MPISEFFRNQRRKLELEDYRPLLNAQSEKRFRFDFLMPLTGESFLGMPEFISEGYSKMEMEGSAIDMIDIGTELEGIFFEAYSTDTIKKPMAIETLGVDLTQPDEQLGRTFAKFANCTVRNFKLVRVKDTVCLRFSLTVRSDGGMAFWAHTYHGGTLWGVFEHSTLKIEAESSSKQMQLTEPALLTKEKSNGHAQAEIVGADCSYTDGNGMRCILAEHEGNHEMAPITQDRDPTVDRRKKTAKLM